MNVEYVDKTTVLVKKSLDWKPTRPKNKIVISGGDVVNEFLSENKNLELVSVEGPRRITNFHREEDASGVWTLKVRNKNVKKTTRPKTVDKKPASDPKVVNKSNTNSGKKKEE